MGKLNTSGKGTSAGGKWWHGKHYRYRNKSHRQFRDGVPRLVRVHRERYRPMHTAWAVGATLFFVAYIVAANHISAGGF